MNQASEASQSPYPGLADDVHTYVAELEPPTDDRQLEGCVPLALCAGVVDHPSDDFLPGQFCSPFPLHPIAFCGQYKPRELYCNENKQKSNTNSNRNVPMDFAQGGGKSEGAQGYLPHSKTENSSDLSHYFWRSPILRT